MFFITEDTEYSARLPLQSLYFYAPWLLFHEKMMLMIEKVEKKHNNIKFVAVDTDYFTGLCKRFDIVSIPTTLILIKGKEKERIEGWVRTDVFESIFSDICNLEVLKKGKDYGQAR